MSESILNKTEIYPGLPLSEWQDTNDTLHLWTQIAARFGSRKHRC